MEQHYKKLTVTDAVRDTLGTAGSNCANGNKLQALLNFLRGGTRGEMQNTLWKVLQKGMDKQHGSSLQAIDIATLKFHLCAALRITA